MIKTVTFLNVQNNVFFHDKKTIKCLIELIINIYEIINLIYYINVMQLTQIL